MKIRLGFVPNSSSSSFIVPIWSNILDKKERVIGKTLEKKLDKYGFKKTHVCNPDQFEMFAGARSDYKEQEGLGYNYGYEVSCNQDDVIRFLVKHRIPFKASVHYGHYTYFYEGGDFIYSFPNYGLIFHNDHDDIEKSIAGMLLEGRGIEKLHITQFMSKKDHDAYFKEAIPNYQRRASKLKKTKKAKKAKK